MSVQTPSSSDVRVQNDGRVQVEQLRLLMGNIGSSVIPGILLSLLMIWVLDNPRDRPALIIWCSGVIFSKLFAEFDARRRLRRGITPEEAPRLVRWQVLLHGIDGLAWGMLAWAALGAGTSVTGNVIIMAVIAGIAGSSMALLSPVLPAFIAFTIMMMLAAGSRFWQLNDPAYAMLGVASLLYGVSLLGQARNSAIAARASILLRFENLELISRLNEEKQHAQNARQEAEHANLAKSRFLASASHDLRQPIHAQGLFLELLSRSELNAHQRMVLAHARATAQASSDMLNTLLDFSRIEAGVVEAQLRSFALQPMLNNIESELAPQADSKDLVYRSRETRAQVHSDPTLVALILRNFVSNAIRYTERGGVLVGCRHRGNMLVVEVWDTGIGIDPAHHREVFREFHQLGNPERDRNKGLGLGLAIADGVANVLQHELTLSSVPGRGSVFRLTLPLAAASDVAETEITEPDQPGLKGLRLLVIDDDETVRIGMKHLLEDWGCHCDTASSIEEALLCLRHARPDILISDYRLREQRTGSEAILSIREALGYALPALLITGDTAPERLREAMASDVPLLHKPVAPLQLQNKLRELLAENPGTANEKRA